MDHHAHVVGKIDGKEYDFCLKGLALLMFEQGGKRSLFGTFMEMHERKNVSLDTMAAIIEAGLHGAGMRYDHALKLVRFLKDKRPISDSFALAFVIAEAALFGPKEAVPAAATAA